MAGLGRAVGLLARARRVPRAQWVAHWRSRPVRRDVVFYQSGFGAGLTGHPNAIFERLLAEPDQAHLHHVWVVADAERRRRAREHLLSRGVSAQQVSVIGYRTPSYFRHLATAGYLVADATFPAEMGKRPGQVYLNTWHGTPLKSMGYDTPGGALESANVLRTFLAADYLLSSGPYMTDTMYRRAYRLEGLAPGSVLEVGSPRTDVQTAADEAERERVRTRLRGLGVRIEAGRPVLLLAPTWRGERFADPRLGADLAPLVATLRERLPGWQVLLKPHPAVAERAGADPTFAGAVVPAEVPANEVLTIADHLVTDYSSILFDALADPHLDLTFWVPDQDDYESSRPLYLPVEELPGRVCRTVEEVVDDVAEGGIAGPQRTDFAARYAPFDDGDATARVVDVVWRGRSPEVGRVVPLAPAEGEGGKPRLMIHAGSLQRNGVTSALIALLGGLDLDRLDVTVTWGPARAADPAGFVAAIDPRVRLLPRVGGINGHRPVVWSRHLLERLGPDSRRVPMAALVALLREEWVRCYATTRFDHVIDFGGYSPYWALLMSRGVAPGPVRTHAIWLHNDLAAEVASAARHGGRRARHLRQVFGLYRRFDRLVSVSEPLSRVNERSFAAICGEASFRYARNLVDAERVRRLAGEPLEQLGLSQEVLSALQDPARPTIVTAGRLTREKHQARLIRAAARTKATGRPFAVVVMGDGPLASDLADLVEQLGLTGAVHLTGHLSNPFPVVAAADCFALTSEHEGLPMVILEALALGTPVLTTAFSSVEGVVPPGCGVVVGNDDEEVARAMIELVSSRPAFGTFDVAAYNDTALREFAEAIGLDETDRPGPPPSGRP
ncbi:hypothetical protein GCM10022199_09230 [Marihabitans asiaticum]|uniref:CDP-glycerol glycerophosphotransferase (TagB/SpsB family) n=1 Tax=Marihabitans asiaticum TaxID=415218 RepID=A0A560WGY1_9MICO|nr:glycosyltransferase [Marihabitans asiaticum]TWD16951.1 CDP-glycerol glycerophosphotransferase (TagB/SpsB family) [Marihabitans asiaticum]